MHDIALEAIGSALERREFSSVEITSHLLDRTLFDFAAVAATGVPSEDGDRAFDPQDDCGSPPGPVSIPIRIA